MGQLLVNPLFNIYKKYRQMIFANPYRFGTPTPVIKNLQIGGVGSTINTPTLLASHFLKYPSLEAFDVADIQNFTIVGNDIQCDITEDYQIKTNIDGLANNINITYYIDYGFCKYVDATSFASGLTFNMINKYIYLEGCIYISSSVFGGNGTNTTEEIILPNALTISNDSFKLPTLSRCYIPKVTDLGGSVLDNNNFFNCTKDLVVYANPFLQTCNSGSPDGDLAYVTSIGGSVRYVTNYIKPNVINSASIGVVGGSVIQLIDNGTSANAIDYYEVYLNGVLYGNVKVNEYLINLALNTTYNITAISVDIFYNKSALSAVVTQITDATFATPLLADYISSWRMENNAIDTIGTNNGTAVSLTYQAGLVGNEAVFASGKRIDLADNNSLSFGNGVTESPFTIVIPFKINTISSAVLIDKRTSSFAEYQVGVTGTNISISLFSMGGVINIRTFTTAFPFVVGQRYVVIITYNGSIVNFYIESVKKVVSISNTGSPTVMTNTTAAAHIGCSRGTGAYFIGSIDELSILNKEVSNYEAIEMTAKLKSGQSLI